MQSKPADAAASFVVYGARYRMLVWFMMMSLANGIIWNTYFSISDIVGEIWDKTEFWINFLSLITMICYLPASVFGTWVLAWDNGLRKCVVFASVMNLASSGVRFLYHGHSYKLAVVSQIFEAIGEASMMGAPPLLAANWFPDHERSTVTSLGTAANLIGISLAFLLGPAIVTTSDDLVYYLGVGAGVSVIACIGIVIDFRSRPPSPPSLSAQLSLDLVTRKLQSMMSKMTLHVDLADAFNIGGMKTISILPKSAAATTKPEQSREREREKGITPDENSDEKNPVFHHLAPPPSSGDAKETESEMEASKSGTIGIEDSALPRPTSWTVTRDPSSPADSSTISTARSVAIHIAAEEGDELKRANEAILNSLNNANTVTLSNTKHTHKHHHKNHHHQHSDHLSLPSFVPPQHSSSSSSSSLVAPSSSASSLPSWFNIEAANRQNLVPPPSQQMDDSDSDSDSEKDEAQQQEQEQERARTQRAHLPSTTTETATTTATTKTATVATPSAAAADASFWQDIKTVMTNRDFLILLTAIGFGLALFWTFSTVLNSVLTEGDKFTSDQAGYCGSLMVSIGLVSQPIAGYLLDRTKAYRALSIVLINSTAVSMLGLALSLNTSSFLLVLTMSGVTGFFMSAFVPVCMEAAVEVTYPLTEGMTGGILIAAANFFGIWFVLAFSIMSSQMAIWMFAGLMQLVAIIFLLFFKPQLKRMNLESVGEKEEGKPVPSTASLKNTPTLQVSIN
eukprot:TRINITY_DN202_c1_g1_i1.p1 TRINITY_DN202_c1_g1~~TRINITY_DN202_c1_g1_i1.p1  ORF type:complete len:738 (+),score=172.60 TRINITY_DN202_c1_g1_i1:167-2380(+)